MPRFVFVSRTITNHLRTLTNICSVRDSSYHEVSRTTTLKKWFVSRKKVVRNTKKWSSYHEKKWFVLRRKGVRITKNEPHHYELLTKSTETRIRNDETHFS